LLLVLLKRSMEGVVNMVLVSERGRKTRTGEGNEVRLLPLDEPAQETCGVEIRAQRAATIQAHV
jgi:hypothetical protein